ncbi:MAG: hypothetical protein J5I47_03245 [Vicingus serpentipes]|nr:hypothetical protein [Vicingus serpentipes]
MDNNKLFSIILIALLGVSALLCALFFASVVSEGVLIGWCYLLLAIAAVSAIVFPVITMAKNPANAKNALIGVLGLVVVFGLGYALASGTETLDVDGKLLATASEAKMSEAGLIAFYILAAAAIGSIVYAEVSKMLK